MNAKPFDTRELKKKIIRHEAIKLDLHQIKTRELQERSCHRVIKANNKTAAAEKHYAAPKPATLLIYYNLNHTNVMVLK